MGADVPDVYFDIYSKSNPHHEKIDTRTLQIILHLAGIPLFNQEKVIIPTLLLQHYFANTKV